jgi:CheY-like chemotaxis protein
MATSARHVVLVVDDEFSSLEVLSLLFEREGFVVRTASDGEEALEQVEREKPDVIVTDFMMPKMTGLELAARLRTLDGASTIPVILVSGTYVGQLTEPNVAGFVRKPFLFERLLQRVRLVLGGDPSSE